MGVYSHSPLRFTRFSHNKENMTYYYLFIPALIISYTVGDIGFRVFAKRKKYSRTTTKVGEFVAGCVCMAALVIFFPPNNQHSVKSAPPSVTGEIKPGMLFDLSEEGVFSCWSMENLEKLGIYIQEHDQANIDLLMRQFACVPSEGGGFPLVTQKVLHSDVVGDVMEFGTYGTNEWRGHTLLSFVHPWENLPQTDINSGTSEVKPGDHFHVNNKNFIACESEESLFDLIKYMADHDEENVNRLTKRVGGKCYGNTRIFPDVDLVVSYVEKVDGEVNIGGDLVQFHRASVFPKNDLYASSLFVNPSLSPTPSAAN